MRGPRGILLMLDFDGTLSPIARTPAEAVLPRRAKAWLTRVAGMKRFKVAVVTGRSLRDIRRKIGIGKIVYAANHGMEIYGGGRMLLSKGRRYRLPLRRLARSLGAALSAIPGVVLEEKGLSVEGSGLGQFEDQA